MESTESFDDYSPGAPSEKGNFRPIRTGQRTEIIRLRPPKRLREEDSPDAISSPADTPQTNYTASPIQPKPPQPMRPLRRNGGFALETIRASLQEDAIDENDLDFLTEHLMALMEKMVLEPIGRLRSQSH